MTAAVVESKIKIRPVNVAGAVSVGIVEANQANAAKANRASAAETVVIAARRAIAEVAVATFLP